jgi:hypothetical protein
MFDASRCSPQNAIIMFGTLGHYSGYSGSFQCFGGSTGITSFTKAQANLRFNIVRENGSTAGHPGCAFNGTSDVSRTWTIR